MMATTTNTASAGRRECSGCHRFGNIPGGLPSAQAIKSLEVGVRDVDVVEEFVECAGFAADVEWEFFAVEDIGEPRQADQAVH